MASKNPTKPQDSCIGQPAYTLLGNHLNPPHLRSQILLIGTPQIQLFLGGLPCEGEEAKIPNNISKLNKLE